MEKIIDIREKYENEIRLISDRIASLETGQIYELTNNKSDGYLKTNARELRKMLNQLCKKIEYAKPSDDDLITEIFIDA